MEMSTIQTAAPELESLPHIPVAPIQTASELETLHHVTVGPNQVGYRRTGRGPALVLLHGWPLHGATWGPLAGYLAHRFTCYAPDLPGHGGTRWSEDTDFSFPGLAQAMRAFAQAVGVREYVLVGNDGGGVVARLMAHDAPDAVRGLVLLNTSIPGERSPEIPFYVWCSRFPGASSLFRHLLRSRAFLRSSHGYGRCFLNRRHIDADFVRRFVRPLSESPQRLEGLLRYMRAVDWDVIDGLAEIHPRLDMPSLLVWGAQDETFPVDLARTMVPQLASCDGLVAVDGARLLVHQEKPDAVAAHITRFCDRHGWC
jgi:pimeloyl-ACP methyl ester carboxylesterase